MCGSGKASLERPGYRLGRAGRRYRLGPECRLAEQSKSGKAFEWGWP